MTEGVGGRALILTMNHIECQLKESGEYMMTWVVLRQDNMFDRDLWNLVPKARCFMVIQLEEPFVL